MRLLALIFAVLAAFAVSPGAALAQATVEAPVEAEDGNRDESDPTFRSSLDFLPPGEAWREPGFRLQLNAVYGGLVGVDGAPGATTYGVEVITGARLDGSWSLLTSLRYEMASGDIDGLAFSAVFEPTWHLWEGLSFGLGLGIGGIVETGEARSDAHESDKSTIVASITYPDAHDPLPTCNGYGTIAVARLSYWFAVGQDFSMGLSSRAGAQWIACEEQTGRVEPDTAEPIVRRQWWNHVMWSLSGGFAWR